MFLSTKNTYNIMLISTDHEFFENIQIKKKNVEQKRVKSSNIHTVY